MLQINYLLSRAFSGYVWIVPGLIAYYLLLWGFHRRQRPLHIAACFLFSFYLFFIIAATGIGNTVAFSFSPEIILVPFRDLAVAPVHFILNIVALIPFGVFLPLLYKRYCDFKIVAVTGFLFSLCIELMQMLGWGTTELDDLIANTIGVCLGYGSYLPLRKNMGRNLREAFLGVCISNTAELILLFASAFLIMAFVQPIL